MKYFSLLARRYKKYTFEKRHYANSDIKFFNFWDINPQDKFWLHRFIIDRNIETHSKKINFFSVFGPRIILKLEQADANIFFSGEALSRFKKYNGYCLDHVDLALGFDELNNQKYLRFPLWIMNFFEPTDSLSIIQQKLNKICYHQNNHTQTSRPYFCSLIASHDENGTRTKILDLVNRIDQVDCAGKLFNNTNTLKTKFYDNKMEFLKSYKFNICPENTNNEGYITEKLFESFSAGCIPIYWGANENPEPEVINKKAILFYNEIGNNQNLINQIRDLNSNKSAYTDFISQSPIQANAAEFILDKMNTLESKLIEIIKNC